MVSAQQNGGASDFTFTPPTTTNNPQSMLLLLLLHKKRRHSTDGRRHTSVYVLMDTLSYSIHIQFFAQNQSLLSPIENQIITKKSAQE